MRHSYRSQRYSRCSQAYQTSIAGVWLVDGVGVVVAELVHDLGDAVVVAFGEGIADGRFKSVIFSLCQCLDEVSLLLRPAAKQSYHLDMHEG